jgi:hypothetical protein
LNVVHSEKKAGQKDAVVGYESKTLPNEVCLYFNFAVVFTSALPEQQFAFTNFIIKQHVAHIYDNFYSSQPKLPKNTGVVEPDPSYSSSATTLSVGGIRTSTRPHLVSVLQNIFSNNVPTCKQRPNSWKKSRQKS